MTDKPRPFAARTTYAHIVQYRLTEGPHKGLVLNAPPDARAFPAPLEFDAAAGRARRRPGSAAYLPVIHDREAHDRLDKSGALTGTAHTGQRRRTVDNRGTS